MVLGLLLSTVSFAGTKKGKGEVTINDATVDYFIQYIRGKGTTKKPLAFILSSDGYWATYYFCPSTSGCSSSNYNVTIRECEEKQELVVDYLPEDTQLCGKIKLTLAKAKYQLLKVSGVMQRLEQN